MTNNERVGLIYKITSPSGKSYIGKTVQSFSKRMYQHTDKNSSCVALARAINKYGWDQMKREIVEENIPEDQLNDREKYWIKTYNTMTPHGYNLMEGGGEGGTHSDISRGRMQETRRKNAIVKNGYRGHVDCNHGIFYPRVWTNTSQEYISRGCKTHEEAVEILRRYTADPGGFEIPEHIRRRGSGSVYFVKRWGNWRAKGPRGKHIGIFDTEEEARSALDKYLISNPYPPCSTSSP